ncbi:Nramp family divalent metal transporter [Ornithinibacillus sp. BX22]|uniref:Nramp family divalent metal transporter n=1 Tax=Ornithinibacillus hominis TaxID=2763055 RepID=A0A923L6K1_9BACI|nr:Nramp family divalent metal transporter [Ornithinibacillus hominis]MBC5637381.1 Nramp family divalent metal transporter [Ornithinibacillus hominis]
MPGSKAKVNGNNNSNNTIKDERISFKDYMKGLGPAAIVVAGIIGPGTITTMSVTGSSYGYQALWIIILACIFAYFYQEPATRITIVKKISIMEGVRDYIGKPVSIFLFITVLIGAIAFQAGNFTGAALALNYFIPDISLTVWALSMSLVALVIAWIGVYKILENINKVLIALMILAFVLTAFFSGPDLGDLVTVGFSFQTLGGEYWLVLALLATTMPPNIVLGLSAFTKSKYKNANNLSTKRELKLSKFDLRLNMTVTALITGAILVCAGTVMYTQGIEVESAADMAVQLTPLLGRYAAVLFSLGLWAAGFSSGLYQISLACMLMNESIGKEEDFKATRSRVIMLVTSLVPIIIIMMFEAVPIGIIVTAQALNGIALPIVAGIVLVLCNKKEVLGSAINNTRQNIIYGFILLVVTLLAIRVFLDLFGII